MARIRHDLKTHPQFYEETISGNKPFEIRYDDRKFKVGDVLYLREWNPETEEYTGRAALRLITYITAFNQKPVWVVLGLCDYHG